MQWVEVRVTVRADHADDAAALWMPWAYGGVASEHDGIPPDKLDEDQVPSPTHLTLRAYLPDDAAAPDALHGMTAALHQHPALADATPHVTQVQDDDWGEAWKRHYHTTRIGRRIVVQPAWEQADAQPGDAVIVLDPGMAFGTGTHPTTRLCLAALEDTVAPGDHVLDLGAGSGILAIGAAKLGAAHVLAVDNDLLAVEATQRNAQHNGVTSQISVQHGSLGQALAHGTLFDMALVNILARIIIAMAAEDLAQVVRPGGVLLLSGLIAEQADDVTHALRAVGLHVQPPIQDDASDWVLLVAQRPTRNPLPTDRPTFD